MHLDDLGDMVEVIFRSIAFLGCLVRLEGFLENLPRNQKKQRPGGAVEGCSRSGMTDPDSN